MSQWRYSEFLEAVENNKVERVLFNKDGDVLQALSEGRRALVIVPKDPQLLDTLLKHNVDFQGAPPTRAHTHMHFMCTRDSAITHLRNAGMVSASKAPKPI